MSRYAIWTLCAVMAAGATPSFAQSVPEGQSCGGLLCDMGVFGHKTAPAADVAPAPSPAPVKKAEAVPQEDAAPEPVKSRPKRPVVPKKRMAKAVSAPSVSTPRPATAAREPVPAPAAAAVPTVRPRVAAETPKSVPASTGAPAATASPIAPPQAPAFQFRPLYNFQ